MKMEYFISKRVSLLCLLFCFVVVFFWMAGNGQISELSVKQQSIGVIVLKNKTHKQSSLNLLGDQELLPNENTKIPLNEEITDTKVTVWISMGLCLSTNTNFLGKRNFPYKEAAILSSRLWKTIKFEYNIRVILHIAYSITNATDINQQLNDFVSKLKQEGVITVILQTKSDECVVVAQTSRLFAYRNKLIKADDIIITSDVDAFPATPALLNPLKHMAIPLNIWQHGVAETSGEKGGTFPMCFISMSKSLWTYVIDCSESIQTCIQPYYKLARTMWGVDQTMLTHNLLTQKRCSINNRYVWKGLGLQPRPFNDTDICRHYNMRNNHADPTKYTWVHFKPTENVADITKAFNDIVKRNI